MLKFIRALFRRKPAPLARPSPAELSSAGEGARALGRLNEVAPLNIVANDTPAVPARARTVSSFVCRDPVLGRDERIAGYEFSLDRQMQLRFQYRDGAIRKMYDDLLIRELAAFSVGSLLGHRLAFIEVSEGTIAEGISTELPRANTVVVIDLMRKALRDPAAVIDRIESLALAGFQVGWKLRTYFESLLPVLARCHFVQIETPAFDGLQLKELSRTLKSARRPRGRAPIRLIARELQEIDDFQHCFRAGFDFFHGPFVTSRKSWNAPKSDVDRTRVIHILNRLRGGEDYAVLAKALRTEPVLTYRLLRYANSAAMGLKREVRAIDQALLVIGVDKLHRWLSLLLFDMKDRGFAQRALVEQVLVRARTMESLSAKSLNPDLAFLTGLLSLLDKLLGRPIADVVLPQISVPDEVKDALLNEAGPYAPLLQLAKVCEQGDQSLIAAAAANCGLAASVVNAQLIASLNWANEVAALT